MLKTRIVTAILLLAIFLAALFGLPGWGWVGLVVVMVMQGTAEWARLAKLQGNSARIYWWLTLAVMLGIVWFDANHIPSQQIFPHLLVYAVSALLWVFVVPTWLISGWQPRQPLLLAFVGWAVLIPTGLAMMDLRAMNPWLLLGVMGLVWVADIAAYFAGRKFGKTKLAPSISPGKTWEGVTGALLGVALYVTLVVLFGGMGAVGTKILPILMLVSWLWVGLAVIGDLFESAIKRLAGVKDSGALLPGHGGLLDRIDALTPTLPLAALVILLQKLA
jgi:phosphatidate cytidylyltransferase